MDIFCYVEFESHRVGCFITFWNAGALKVLLWLCPTSPQELPFTLVLRITHKVLLKFGVQARVWRMCSSSCFIATPLTIPLSEVCLDHIVSCFVMHSEQEHSGGRRHRYSWLMTADLWGNGGGGLSCTTGQFISQEEASPSDAEMAYFPFSGLHPCPIFSCCCRMQT